jgi:glycosyltransferase involved in cell wall biosynthesis
MRVLWFTNYPSLASELLNEEKELRDWVAQLEKQVSILDNIELGLVFYYNGLEKKFFKIASTSYFALPKRNSYRGVNRVLNRWRHKSEYTCDLDFYLEAINTYNPDLIHIFGTEQTFGLICSLINIPTIIQIQGNLTTICKKWYLGISNYDILKFSNFWLFIRAIGLWHQYYYFVKRSKLEQKIFKSAKYFIGRTEWDKRIVAALSNKGKYYHCDELLRDVFYHNIWRKPSNNKLFITSTLSPDVYKGLETILETASILRSKPKLQFEWLIIGVSGEEELVKIMEKKYRLKFIEQGIIFKGLLNAESVIETLLNSDVYVHPSHIENSANSICEAMLIGMPLIATFAGGTPSIVQDKIEGILVQDGDPYALAGAIIEISANSDYPLKLAENARKKAMNRHNPANVIADLQNIYSSIMFSAQAF